MSDELERSEEDALIDAFLIDQAGLTAKAQTASAAE